MLKTGIRARKKRITWDKQVLRSGRGDETPSAITGALTRNHTLQGTLTQPTVLRAKRRLGDAPKAVT